MKNNKGITIVVLIVIIIIMLILVAVGINFIIDESIIEESYDAVDDANGRIEQEEQTTNKLLNEWSQIY